MLRNILPKPLLCTQKSQIFIPIPIEAYDLMYNNFYNLIISDIIILGISRFEFAQTVREINKMIPILFMTAKDKIASKQKGFWAGIDNYMVNRLN